MTTSVLSSSFFFPRFFCSSCLGPSPPSPSSCCCSSSSFFPRSRRGRLGTYPCQPASHVKPVFPCSSHRRPLAPSSLSYPSPSFSVPSSSCCPLPPSAFSSSLVPKTSVPGRPSSGPHGCCSSPSDSFLSLVVSSFPTSVRCVAASPVARLAKNTSASPALEGHDGTRDGCMSAASTQVPEEEMHAKASVFSSSTASSSSSKVKLLRSRTGGVSIGECRKALDASNWDVEAAVVYLRKRGIARGSSKPVHRDRKDGLISITTLSTENYLVASLVEVNSETDFVSRHPRFVAFTELVGRALAKLLSAACRSATTEAGPGKGSSVPSISSSAFSLLREGEGGGRMVKEKRGSGEREEKEENATLLEALKDVQISSDGLKEIGVVGGGLCIEPTASSQPPAGSASKHEGADSASRLFQTSDGGNASPASSASLSPPARTSTAEGTTMSIRDVLSLLSQQFGEQIDVSRCAGLSIPMGQTASQDSPSVEEDGGKPIFSYYAVGSYIHNKISEKNVGRSGALVVLKWMSSKKSLLDNRIEESSSLILDDKLADNTIQKKMQFLARLLAMQCIATRPRFLRYSDIDSHLLEMEKQIIRDSLLAKGEGCALSAAPPDVLEKAVKGRLSSLLKEQILLEQEFLLSSQLEGQLFVPANKHNEGRERSGSVKKQQGSRSSEMNDIDDNSLSDDADSKLPGYTMPRNMAVKDVLKYVASYLNFEKLEVSGLQVIAIDESSK